MINIKGSKLHNKQKEILKDILSTKSKYYIINASRQSGKSYLLAELVRFYCLTQDNIKLMYVTPTYGLASTLFDNILSSLEHTGVLKSINKSKLSLTFINKSVLFFKSAERYDNIRGLSNDYVFLDEFSFFKHGAWDAIKPTILAKVDSKVIIVSTPKGKNLFYDMAMLGESTNDRYKYYYMHYTDNPKCDLLEIEDAKKVLPEDIYLTEYEAKFIDDGGSVFKDLTKNQIITEWQQPINNEKYFAGLDIGKKDSTVLTIFNSKGEVVYIHRVNNMSYNKIIESLLMPLNLYNPLVYVEVNGVGDVLFDMLQLKYSRLVAWQNTNSIKTQIIEGLIYDLENESIKIPTAKLLPELDFELKVFTYEYNPKTRTIKYAATPPHNDDCVISLALANYCRNENKFIGKRIVQKRFNKHSY